MIRPILLSVALVSIFSCSKSDSTDNNNTDDGVSPENKAQAAALTEYLQTGEFHLTKYYSDTPIDYIDTDQVVKAETDLWKYVSPWLHDDVYTFNSNGDVTIQQNADKLPEDSSATITRHYNVEADKDGVSFDFVGHQYQDLTYRLITFNDTMLRVSASWNGKTVISEFGAVK
jgi:hypothetical protein